MPNYFNSTFQIKPGASRMKRSSMPRSTKPMKRSGKLRPIGKKSRNWIVVRRRLSVEFAALGVTSCELRYEGCQGARMLGFAHGRKRRHLKGDELETLVILACNPCHDKIEYLGPERMFEIVASTIQRRNLNDHSV